ncbi:MAG: hypothetical protein R2705_11885 [Ilumatobacteraceae bacterium]
MPVLRPSTPLWVTFLAWGLGGLGMGLLFNPTTVFAMSTAPEGEAGQVSSWLNMADSLGFALIGGVGGAIVAFADHGSFPLRVAILATFLIAVASAVVGEYEAGRVRPA